MDMGVPETSGQSSGDGRYGVRRRPRWAVLAAVALLHLAVFTALIRAFAPAFPARAIKAVTSIATVTITSPPEPAESPPPMPEPDAGAAAEEGREATPREVAAPEAPLPRPSPAPPVSSTGDANVSGAADEGIGTGAGGEGEGTGSGAGGTGQGGGARPLELISGTINNARDYPTPRGGRAIRRGHDVIIELRVNTAGRVESCRVTDPSPDPEADAITCRLATERFVFRPRLDASGREVPGIYRWRQQWF